MVYYTCVGQHRCNDTWGVQVSGLPNGNVATSQPSIVWSESDQTIVMASGHFNTDSIVVGPLIETEASSGSINMGIMISKATADGGVNWIRSLNGSTFLQLAGISVSATGEILFGGQFRGELTLGDTSFTNNGSVNSFFLLCLHENGEFNWAVFDTTAASGTAAITNDGSSFWAILGFSESLTIGGETHNADTSQSIAAKDFLIINIDNSGDVEVTRQISGSGTGQVRSCDYINDCLVISGVYNNEIEIAQETLNGSIQDSYYGFQLSYSIPADSVNWLMGYGTGSPSSGSVQPRGSMGSNDTLITAVGVFSTDSLTIGAHSIYSQGQSDGFVLGIDSEDGSVLWLREFGGPMNDELIDISNSSYGQLVSGYFKSDTIEYIGNEFHNATQSSTADPVVMVIDDEGKFVCELTGLGNAGEEVAFASIWTANQMYSLISFNTTFNYSPVNNSATGIKDLMLLGTCLECDTLTSIHEYEPSGLAIYPNPATTAATITLPKAGAYGLNVIDATGRVVCKDRDCRGRSSLAMTGSVELDVSTWSQGIYAITATSQDGVRYTGRLVVGR